MPHCGPISFPALHVRFSGFVPGSGQSLIGQKSMKYAIAGCLVTAGRGPLAVVGETRGIDLGDAG